MSGSVGLPPIPAYLSIVKNEQTAVTKTEAGDVSAQTAVAHFKQVAGSIATPQALLSDYRSLSVVLGAFGMSSDIGETAIIKQLMTQDPTSKTSLAQTSGNALWQRFAQQMSSWTSTSTPLTTTNVSTIASQYLTNQFETNQGSSTPGMQQALYFTRTASSVSSINALMSDPTQLNVVETVLGLDPDQFGALDFNQQQAILTQDVNLKQFSTTTGIQRYAEQYLAMTELNPPSVAQTFTVASLFDTSDDSPSLFSIIGNSLNAQA